METITDEPNGGTGIAEYSPTAAALADLRNRYDNVAFDLTTTKGADEARKARRELVTLRTSLEAKRKELKAPALAHAKMIDDEAKRLTSEIVAIELPIDEQIKAAEAAKEAERAAKEQAEAERIAQHQSAIDAMRALVGECVGKSSLFIGFAIAGIKPREMTAKFFEEYAPAAERAKTETLAKLTEMHVAALASEQKAEADRIERERIAAEQAAEAKRLAEERAELARQQAAIQEAQEKARRDADEHARVERERLAKIEEAARLAREQADAEAAAIRLAADKAARDQLAVEQARIDAERTELRRQQDEQDKADRERQQAEARAADAVLAAERQAKYDAELAAAMKRSAEAEARRAADDRIHAAANIMLSALREVQADAEFSGLSPESQCAVMGAIFEATGEAV